MCLCLLIDISQFEEKFDDVNGAEPPVSFPIASVSGTDEQSTAEMVAGHDRGKEIEPRAQQAQVDQTCSDVNASQEFGGGMMKIVPSDVDVSILLLTNLLSVCKRKIKIEIIPKLKVNHVNKSFRKQQSIVFACGRQNN